VLAEIAIEPISITCIQDKPALPRHTQILTVIGTSPHAHAAVEQAAAAWWDSWVSTPPEAPVSPTVSVQQTRLATRLQWGAQTRIRLQVTDRMMFTGARIEFAHPTRVWASGVGGQAQGVRRAGHRPASPTEWRRGAAPALRGTRVRQRPIGSETYPSCRRAAPGGWAPRTARTRP
jgi:hypothetical protein